MNLKCEADSISRHRERIKKLKFHYCRKDECCGRDTGSSIESMGGFPSLRQLLSFRLTGNTSNLELPRWTFFEDQT